MGEGDIEHGVRDRDLGDGAVAPRYPGIQLDSDLKQLKSVPCVEVH